MVGGKRHQFKCREEFAGLMVYVYPACLLWWEGEYGIWFWNQSANETESDSKEEDGGKVDEKYLEQGQSRTEQAVSIKLQRLKYDGIKRENRTFVGGYGNGSKRTQMRNNKSAQELVKEASMTYNIQVL